MKPENAPGPDSFTLSYYKIFQDITGTKFATAYKSILKDGDLPQDTLQAMITIIPKVEKDLQVCLRYRLISLLQIDLKIFTRIWWRSYCRTSPSAFILTNLAFVPEREARNNMQWVLNAKC